ncbi:hypothetical protein [Duganella sp. CF458]|uniref:hypothetical protein n=1 Tax=Duganella sp. CF458 TaxID=1884368 RepID=UPI0011140971|nr:hypothetical protein [Duganella sp. CF458]
MEALLWLIVTCVVLAVFLGRISFYTESAELRAIEITLSQLRAAIELHRLRSATGIALEGTNPMRLLAVPPGNYAGEFASIASAPAEPGTWFYDRQSKKLVYVLLNAEKAAEKATPRQQKMLHFKLELRRLPKTSARPSEPPADNAGVVLNQLDD